MNTRIKELRKSLGLNQQEFADSLLLSRTTVSSFESGAKSPSTKTIELITLKHDIRKEWLLNGTGEMRTSSFEESVIYNQVLELLGEEDKLTMQAIKSFISLSNEDKKFVDQLICRLKK